MAFWIQLFANIWSKCIVRIQLFLEEGFFTLTFKTLVRSLVIRKSCWLIGRMTIFLKIYFQAIIKVLYHHKLLYMYVSCSPSVSPGQMCEDPFAWGHLQMPWVGDSDVQLDMSHVRGCTFFMTRFHVTWLKCN